jgi:hypothetical protein
VAASLSLVEERGPQLWRASPEEERLTLAGFAAPHRFAELAQRFLLTS